MSTSSPTYDIRVILPHPSAQRVLLCPTSGGGWELPRWVTSERHFWQSAGYVDDGVRELLGISVTTLRCLWTAYDTERACSVRWYELENVGSGEEPRQGEWRGIEALGDLVDAQDRALLAEWFREAAQGVPERRRPWARRGWLAQAVTRIDEQLAQLGVSRVGPVEQVRTWERGCVLRVPATGGSLYFKALPAMFGHETRLIEMLARVRPSAVVTVLALDRERQWMLMADMGDHALDGVAELARWEEALHLALLYDRILLPNMEARWEMENMVGYYLKMLLRESRGKPRR